MPERREHPLQPYARLLTFAAIFAHIHPVVQECDATKMS